MEGLAQGRIPEALLNQIRGARGVRIGGPDGAEGEIANVGEALSPEDEANIQTVNSGLMKLVAMGPFTREQCIEVYIACNKNVEQAANLLLDGN